MTVQDRDVDEGKWFAELLDRASLGLDLGDPADVLKVVGQFAHDLFERPADVESLCRKMGRIFTGLEKGYAAVGMWNDGGGFDDPPAIAAHVLKEIKGLPAGATADETVANAFGVLATRLLTESKTIHRFHWEAYSGQMIQMFANMLMGLPQTPDE